MDILQLIGAGEMQISGENSISFAIRLLVNIISTFVLIRFIYYPRNSRANYIFTFFLMGMMIFLIASILDQVNLNMAFALGLFAIFGIIRFRSPSIDLKEMTYLFLVIGVSIINALVEFNVAEWLGLVVANAIVIISAAAMENYRPKNHILKRMMVITPSDYSILNNNELLLQEVKKITGIEVLKVDLVKINKVKNEISLWVIFDGHNGDFKFPQEEQSLEIQETHDQWVSTNTDEY